MSGQISKETQGVNSACHFKLLLLLFPRVWSIMHAVRVVQSIFNALGRAYSTTFRELGLSDSLVERLKNQGFEFPTEVQQKVSPSPLLTRTQHSHHAHIITHTHTHT